MALFEDETNMTDIQDIDLSVTNKKEFRINGDNSKILRLNTSDLHVLKRMGEIYPKLQKLADDALNEMVIDDDATTEEIFQKSGATLTKIDTKMRELIDELFDSNVSEVCAPEGSMFDPINGKFRYEHIVDVLGNLYEKNLREELDKTARNIAKHTDKYTH